MDGSPLISLFLDSFELFGISACGIVLSAMLVSFLVYKGRDGERYSVLNHFVSELGEAGVSRAAGVFNGGLIAAGFLFIPFTFGLGVAVAGVWSKLGILAGLWTAVSCIRIGIFSMDRLEPHIHAAMGFFNGGWITVLLFTLGIWLQPVGTEILPRSVVWIGLACLLANTIFLIGNPRPPADAKPVDFLWLDPSKERPRVWRLAVMEWIAVLSSVIWYLSTALILALA